MQISCAKVHAIWAPTLQGQKLTWWLKRKPRFAILNISVTAWLYGYNFCPTVDQREMSLCMVHMVSWENWDVAERGGRN